MTLRLRYMRLDDIPQVVAIDRHSFDTPWSARSYAYEVKDSHYSHMVALEHDYQREARGWWRRFTLPGLNGSHNGSQLVVGYGGLWHIMDEAHISTIAVHRDWRRRGWGELLLAGMICRAITLDAAYVVLEVRVSNSGAQQLYKKYAFETIAVKRRYYRDNGEDAYDMRLDLSVGRIRQIVQGRYAVLRERHGFIDEYSAGRRPLLSS